MNIRSIRNAVLLLLATGLCSVANGQDKALLYEVSGKGLTQPSYLYGTFHMVCPEDLKLSAATSKAMTDARQLYLEIDFDDPAFQANVTRSMTFSDGHNLKDLMKPADYALLDSYLRRTVGASLDPLAAFKPIALMSLVFQGMLKCEPASYDLTFAAMAAQSKKEVLGLETVDAQMSALDKIPLNDQIDELLNMVRRPEEAQKELASLMAAYKAQDIAGLMKLMSQSEFDSDAKFEEDVLNKRNANWIPVIEKAAAGKPTFFAFGAAHLGGPKGVINLLREKGYNVKPLP